MKYRINITEIIGKKYTGVTTTPDEIVLTFFPAEIGNPNYDAFLEQTQLTDKQVHNLKSDVWYDFPESDPA